MALDQASLRWAAAEGVTETVIAAVLLLHERSVEEIAGKLTPAELADVTRLVSRCPSCYPSGAYDALKAWRNAAAEQPGTRTTAANRPLRGGIRASAELGPHTERAGLAERTNRAHDAKDSVSTDQKRRQRPVGTSPERAPSPYTQSRASPLRCGRGRNAPQSGPASRRLRCSPSTEVSDD